MLFGKLHVIKRDGGMGSEYPITENIVIGSDPSVSIKLNTDNVSERQCQIVTDASTKALHLEVLDATHVTAIDGQPLNSGERKKLENGNIVAVGDRLFKIMYPKSYQDKMTRTPARSGGAPNPPSAQKRRKSIFDSTPPVPTKTPTTPQKNVKIDPTDSSSATSSAEVPKTPTREALPRTSPRQPKGILSAKKNILVTRTPTMSPKVVRWGSPKYKSPTSPGTSKPLKPARKSTPALLPRSPVVAMRKRSFGTLDEKIKKLAALPTRRRSSTSASASVKPDTSIVDEVPETPDTSCLASDDLSAVPEKLATPRAGTGSRRSSVASSGSRSSARTSTGSTVSRKSETTKPSPVATPNTSKRMSTSSNVSTASSSSSSSRKNRVSQTFRVSPITTPNQIGLKRLSTKSPRVSSSRSSISSTSSRKSRQSFRTSPSVSHADVFSSTIAASPDVLNGSGQPADSFGSLSVSEADLSVFDGTLINGDGSEHSTLKGRRSSGASSKQRSRVSRSPKAESLMEVDEVGPSGEVVSEQPTADNSEVPEATASANAVDEPVSVASRRSSRLSTASSSKETPKGTPEEGSRTALPSSSNQENKEPLKKTWAGVLKRSIASGSPFKVNQRRSFKLKSTVKSNVARALKKNHLQVATEAEIVAAFASTGHALSPQTIFINKKLNANTLLTKTTPKRNSSLLNKTHDIELEMFVSPFNTPDNSEALERARDFVKKLPSSRKSTSHNSSSLSASAIESPKPVARRRSTRSSGTPVIAVEEVSESEQPVVGDTNDADAAGSAEEAESNVNPGSSRKSTRRSTGTNLQGVKNLLATPKGVQSPENNLDCDMRGLKKMLATPKAPRSPENDLERDVGGVKKIFATPKGPASPKNELDGSFGGVKKLLKTPKNAASPKNELDGNFSGVKKLLKTPKQVVPPKNELDGNFSGVKRLLRTPKEAASPKNELDGNFSGMKKMLRTPKDVKSPENNLDCDYRGTKRLFRTPESPEKRAGRGLDDSALEGVQQLLNSTTPKRKPTTPVESKAKRVKPSASEDREPSGDVLENGKVLEIVEEEVNTRSPMARSKSKRVEKIERVQPEHEAEPVVTMKTRKTKMTKTSAKLKSVTPAKSRTTKGKTTKAEEAENDDENVQEVEEHSSETATESEHSAEELAAETGTRTRTTRRKKVEFVIVPEMKTPTTGRKGRAAKSNPAKTAVKDDPQPSEAESQPSGTESQQSEAESEQSASSSTARNSRRRVRRQVDEDASHDDEPTSAAVRKPVKRAGRGRRQVEEEVLQEDQSETTEMKPPKSSGRVRKPKVTEVVLEEVSETPAEASGRGRRKKVTKLKTTRTAKQPNEEQERAEAPSENSGADAEPETPARKQRGGRKATSKFSKDESESAMPPPKRTRVVKTAKNKIFEPEESGTAPETNSELEPKKVGKKRKVEPSVSPTKKTETAPEVTPDPEPKKASRKRKVEPSVSPTKKTETKKRARKADSEVPASTSSTRTTRARRR